MSIVQTRGIIEVRVVLDYEHIVSVDRVYGQQGY